MMHSLNHGTRRLYVLFLAGFAVFGILFTIIGAALPQIIRTFHWSYALTGLVLAANAVGYFLSTFFCGFLVQRFSPAAGAGVRPAAHRCSACSSSCGGPPPG